MRKTYLIGLLLFLIISVLFYAPVRRIFTGSQSVTHHQSSGSSPALEAVQKYLQPSAAFASTVYAFADSTLIFKNNPFYTDTLAEIHAVNCEISDRELQFRTILLPRGEKEIRLLLYPLSDSLKVSFNTDTGLTERAYSAGQGVQALCFKPGKHELSGFSINFSGRVRLTRPVVLYASRKSDHQKKVPLLLVDLPPAELQDLQKSPLPGWHSLQLIPPAFTSALALPALLSGEQAAGNSTLPVFYHALMEKTAAAMNPVTSNNPMIFLGLADSVSRPAARLQCAELSLLVTKPLDSQLLNGLATDGLNSLFGRAYLYQPHLQNDRDKLLDRLKKNELAVPNLRQLLFSSETPEFHKTAVLLSGQDRQVKSRSLADLLNRLSSPAEKYSADSLAFSEIVREDSVVYCWQGDSVIRIETGKSLLQGVLYSEKGKKLGDISLSSLQRRAVFQPEPQIVKILTLINKSNTNIVRRLVIRSPDSFGWEENGVLQQNISRSISATIPPGALSRIVLICSKQNQLFTYSSDQLSAAYGAVALPVTDLNELQDFSVLTAAHSQDKVDRRYDLIIENFSTQPLWRYRK